VISVQPFGKWYARSLGSTASPWKTTSDRKLVDHLDQAILTKAFRGELVPQDSNDEPVNVLPERIRAEREVRLSTRRSSIKKK
jgi:hypothetical protein